LEDGRHNPITSDMLNVSPKVINGDGDNDTVSVRIFTDNFILNPEQDGKITIYLIATDKAGKSDTLVYRLQLSDVTDFICNVTVTNARGASQVLQFGTSSLANSKEGVTTGDGTDSPALLGLLDYQLCEFELPPMPPLDVFDARWSIPLRNGTLRNIYPVAQAGIDKQQIYKARFQAGGETGGISTFFPVTIAWKPVQVPTVNDAVANPTAATWYIRDFSSNGNIFDFEMTTPDKRFNKAPDILAGFNANDPELFEIVVNNPSLNSFIIVHDALSSVENNDVVAFGINNVTPNPVATSSVVNYSLVNSSEMRIDLVDALGNIVSTIESGFKQAGNYNIEMNNIDNAGRQLPSGTYTIRIVADNESRTYPVVIVK
jgi:hypothetical protein